MSEKGMFILSLDFELNWGVHDVFTKEQYGENILGVRQAVPQILSLFQQYDIHATWATVGMLFFESKEELLKSLPSILPTYDNANFSPYNKMMDIGENEQQDPFHFGKSLIQKIVQVPHQEIGTHTFSHYYCLEKGQNFEQFQADLEAFMNISNEGDIKTRSLVFPRNQTNPEYLSLCKDMGISSYRGNEEHAIYRASNYKDRGKVKRAIRFADCYINLTGHHTYKVTEIDKNHPINLRSSRFLRPYHPKMKWIEKLRLNRIKSGITYAAMHGEVFHLWWHPHNFGKHLNENIYFLRNILEHVTKMGKVYGLKSLTMSEAAMKMQKTNEGVQNQFVKI